MEEIVPKGIMKVTPKGGCWRAAKGAGTEEGKQSGTTRKQTDDVIVPPQKMRIRCSTGRVRRGMTVQFA